MTGLPSWLRKHLETTTGLDYTTARGKYATLRHCPNCHTLILTGMCGDPGWTVNVDPTPLTPQQEVACLLTHRRTYTLFETGRRIEISRTRDKWAIEGHPAGTATVVPTHHCGARFPEPEPTPHTRLATPDTRPPF